jgi:hypothetical protein
MCTLILKSLSTTLYDERLSTYPDDCKMELVAEIGQQDSGSSSFYFTVVTVKHIENISPIWHCPPKGYLIQKSFSWEETENMISKLLSHQPNGNLEEKVAFLSKYLNWEYENYQP